MSTVTMALLVALSGGPAAGEEPDEQLPPAIPAGTYTGTVDEALAIEHAWSDGDTRVTANEVELRVADDGSVSGTLEVAERGTASPPQDSLVCPGGGSRWFAEIDAGQVIGPELPQQLEVSIELGLYSAYSGEITPEEVKHFCIDPVLYTYDEPHVMTLSGYADGKVTGTLEPWPLELTDRLYVPGMADAQVAATQKQAPDGADDATADPAAITPESPRERSEQRPPDAYGRAIQLFRAIALDESQSAGVREGALRQLQALQLLVAPGDGSPPASPSGGQAPTSWVGTFANIIAAAPNLNRESYDAITNLGQGLEGSRASDPQPPQAVTRPAKPPPKMKPKQVKAGRQWVSLDADHEVDKIVSRVDPQTKKRRYSRNGRITLRTGTWYQAKERTKDIVFYDTMGTPIGVAGRDDKRGLQYEPWHPAQAE